MSIVRDIIAVGIGVALGETVYKAGRYAIFRWRIKTGRTYDRWR